ncbi:hypothetical protein [Phytomonospora endophytica]|uniref:Arc-like DNA binding domain-containing protein n=1 Tax=Phytomonospora endophytica TaxID=714109 RepID=A0A841FJZ9_9ACTN|nr:hypothetical protein [Phytomonospora endophytica]MBB6037651.1 hypothetical protein [Phytomonospora endophytica]GIG67824.1 hypothetical protein Pen01_41190 [Phytomonospora endophytica]
MDIATHVQRLGQEFAAVAETSGPEARALFEQFAGALEPAIRLTLIEALADAADEISRDLAPGSVQLRLRGREPSFVVTPTPASPVTSPTAEAPAHGDPHGETHETHEGPAARINFRPPEQLKSAIEDAAAREGRSVNAWLVRVTSAALRRRERDEPPPFPFPFQGPPPGTRHPNRFNGWAR